MAEKVRVSRQTVSNWENDRSYPDIAGVLALAELYRLSLDELLREDKRMLRHLGVGHQHIHPPEEKQHQPAHWLPFLVPAHKEGHHQGGGHRRHLPGGAAGAVQRHPLLLADVGPAGRGAGLLRHHPHPTGVHPRFLGGGPGAASMMQKLCLGILLHLLCPFPLRQAADKAPQPHPRRCQQQPGEHILQRGENECLVVGEDVIQGRWMNY